MARLTLGDLACARAVFRWAVREGFMAVGQYHELMHSVARRAVAVVGCDGKDRFDSYRLADTVAKRMNRHREGELPVSAYHCDECRDYHVGRPSETATVYRQLREQLRLEEMA